MSITDDETRWWRRGVVYQVYIRSFADGDGDGTGDIAGLRSRLRYLSALGIDAIWINPWFASPMRDGGYDVADYLDINPMFGTLGEAEQFIAEARSLGIRVIVDIVPNHTSSLHPWFQEALADPTGPARDRYIFRAGRGPTGDLPPNNWRSVFGGPAWTRVDDGQWYLHLFDTDQPDLDWTNPAVVEHLHEVLRFWLDRGVSGFRIDVAHGLVKDPDLPDLEVFDEFPHVTELMDHPYWDRDGLHEIVRDWRSIVDEYPGTMMVAEAWVHPERLPLYLRPDEYHQSFNFELLETPWNATRFSEVIASSTAAATAVGATSTWVLSNHDVVRHVTRYGLSDASIWRRWLMETDPEEPDLERGRRRARAAALITLSLPGSAYVYQGEELGLYEVLELPDEARDDPIWHRTGHLNRGRDGCRVPIPWEPEGPSFGFGDGGSWLPQPTWFGPLSAAAQHGDPGSMLELYRRAIACRRQHLLEDDRLEMLEGHPADVVAYRRGSGIVCLVNMGAEPVPLPAGEILLASDEVDGSLPADTAVWLIPNES